jgi:hypothetical protein
MDSVNPYINGGTIAAEFLTCGNAAGVDYTGNYCENNHLDGGGARLYQGPNATYTGNVLTNGATAP